MVEFRPGLAIAVLLAACFGCAAAPPPPAPPVAPVAVVVLPRPLSESEIESAAAFLQLEDRREFRTDVFEVAATAPEASIRARAVYAAGRIAAPESRPFVRRFLSDPDSSVAAAAAFAAGHLRDTTAVPLLAALLEPQQAAIRSSVAAEAASSLGRIAVPESRAALTGFLQMADTSAALRPVVAAALIGAWRAGEEGIDPFTRWLSAESGDIRWRATYGLTRRPRPEAVPHLGPLLADSAPLVRAFALRGLNSTLVSSAGFPVEMVTPLLVQALADAEYIVRIEAIRALGTYHDPASAATLIPLLEVAGRQETVAVLEALGQIGIQAWAAADTVRRIAVNPAAPDFLRATAIVAYTAIAPDQARELLDEVIADPSWRVRSAVAQGLATFKVTAIPQLTTLTRDQDPRVAAAALQAAVGALDKASMPLLRPLLTESLQASDAIVRAAALSGFSVLADQNAFPLLLDAYAAAEDDFQNDAALAAIDALADLGLTGEIRPERAFFARFQRSNDYLVRQKAITRFLENARTSWGEAFPLEPLTRPEDYRTYVDQWIAPPPIERTVPIVRIETEEGLIDAVLFASAAPLTVANFLRLAHAGFFDGQEWPRVVPNFVVQGGDPRGDMNGSPGYSIRDEMNRVRYETGTLGMALSGPDTGGSQFFITHSPQPHLDGGYTVFGRVISGQDVVERILPGQRIISVREIAGTN